MPEPSQATPKAQEVLLGGYAAAMLEGLGKAFTHLVRLRAKEIVHTSNPAAGGPVDVEHVRAAWRQLVEGPEREDNLSVVRLAPLVGVPNLVSISNGALEYLCSARRALQLHVGALARETALQRWAAIVQQGAPADQGPIVAEWPDIVLAWHGQIRLDPDHLDPDQMRSDFESWSATVAG